MLNRFVSVVMLVCISCLLHAQGFPDAQKQPRMKEQHHNKKRYSKAAHRRHVKRGTAFIQPTAPRGIIYYPQCILACKRDLLYAD